MLTSIDATVSRSGATVISIDGRLDMLGVSRFKALVTSAVSRRNTPVVVDLSGVDFMDSSGLSALVSGLRTTRQAGSDFRIASAGAQVLAVLVLTKIDQIIPPYGSVAEALGAG